MECIDHVWYNLLRRHKFDKDCVQHLTRVYSDHHPLLISCHGLPFVPISKRPFWVELSWFSHPDFPRLVQQCWDEGGHYLIEGISHLHKISKMVEEGSLWVCLYPKEAVSH